MRIVAASTWDKEKLLCLSPRSGFFFKALLEKYCLIHKNRELGIIDNQMRQLQNLKKNKITSDKIVEVFILRSWWAILFILICYGFYAQGMQKKKETYQQLSARLHQMENEMKSALQKREDLLLQIESQNDPAWIEMTLMRKLGVVPEGQTKVYFEKDEP